MRNCSFILFIVMLVLGLSFAEDNVTIIAPTSEAAEGLDLKAVSELFKESENLEEFEKALNDPEIGVNNLDLDEDNQVDFIRVVEEVADDTHIIILQVPLGENEFQDVATIEVEKSDDNYNMQVRGNEIIYGPDYYVAPTVVHVHTWPIITWIYRPVYRPYRSVFYFGYYPSWYRPWRPVTINVYHTRTVHYHSRSTFTITRTNRVKTVSKVNYQPKTSTRVTRKTTVTRKTSANQTKSTSVGVKRTTNSKTGRTTTKAGVKRTTRNSEGQSTTRKAGVKKTTNEKSGRTTVKKGTQKTTRSKSGNKRTVTKSSKRTTRK